MPDCLFRLHEDINGRCGMIDEKSFLLTEVQVKRLNRWAEIHIQALHNHEKANPIFAYTFTPSGIGVSIILHCSCGAKLDASDYENW